MAMSKLQRPTNVFSPVGATTQNSNSGSLETKTALLVSELMNAATSIHKLHLKVTGIGSYAAHKALNELYDALPGHADDLAEGFQGASEKLLSYTEPAVRCLDSVDQALSYLRELTSQVSSLQSIMPYSEIVNDLDAVKSTINSIKYKLLFLK
jgi:DNA-binding ferritin-like protein